MSDWHIDHGVRIFVPFNEQMSDLVENGVMQLDCRRGFLDGNIPWNSGLSLMTSLAVVQRDGKFALAWYLIGHEMAIFLSFQQVFDLELLAGFEA